MRIALVASSYLPRLGGVEEHVYHLSRHLRRRGHDVAVWAPDQGDSVPDADDGAPLRYLPTPLPNRSIAGAGRWLAQLSGARAAWGAAERQDAPEVIVVQCFGSTGPWATALARRTGAPLVYANHGETFMDAHDSFQTSRLLRRALQTTLRSARAVTSCSAYAAADLDRFGSHPQTTIVGNGIELDLPGEAIVSPLPTRYIAGVGRLVDNKGFDVLIDAFARARRDLADGTQLVLGGAGPAGEALAARAHQRGIADHVHFTGPLSRGQVRTLLDGALLHVVPSRVEAFGIVILEGWRSRVPVLSTNVGGPADIIDDGVDGLLFDPTDADRLATLIVRVAADTDLRSAVVDGGAQSVTRYSWERVADLYEVALRDAIAGAVRAPQEHRS